MRRFMKMAVTSLYAVCAFINSAVAQVVVIPHGGYDSDFEKYFVATVSLALLGFAAWRYWGSRR